MTRRSSSRPPSSGGNEPGSLAVGHRIPLIPPVGTVFCAQASDEEVERWLSARQGVRGGPWPASGDNLAAVRRNGYSLSLVPQDPTDRVALMSDYSGVDVMPMHERRIRQMISESASLYEPMLDPALTHDLHSVIVPLPTDEEQTRLARAAVRAARPAPASVRSRSGSPR